MRTPWLCSFVMFGATAACGQTNSPPATPQSDASRTVAVTGCVARGHKSEPITLTHAMVLPFGVPVATQDTAPAPDWFTPPLLDPARLSASATQPPQGAQSRTKPPPTGSAIPDAVGTSGTSVTIVGTAPVGSSASSVDGYRLSGVDMTSWIGRRVQLIGKLIPAGPTPEFRVTSVEPVSGPCPR
jgi:hypothetical protein